MKRKIRDTFLIILIILLIPILFVSAVILIDAVLHPNEIPSFFGWKPFIVLSGSMETEFESGDLVVVKEVDSNDLKKNDIIAFRINDIVVTHRIIQVNDRDGEKTFITRGDINSGEDQWKVEEENIEGIYKFRIKGLGNVAIFLQTPIGMISCLSVPVISLFLLQWFENRRYRKLLNCR